MSIPHLEWSQGARKIGIFEILFCRETTNYFHLRAQHCQNYASHGKKLKIKSCSELHFDK